MKKPSFKQSSEAVVLGLETGLVAIYLLIKWRFQQNIPELVYAAAGIGLLSVLFKKVAEWVAVGWMTLGQFMGKIVGSVLLSVVYLLVLTPLAKLQRVFTSPDKFKSGDQVKAESAWKERKHTFGSKDLDELW